MMSSLVFAYEVLCKVYKEGAYLSVALPPTLSFLDGKDKAKVTRIVYGVIEKHEEFTYALGKLCKKSPRPNIRVILRMGMYLLKYSDGMPEYAAVNEIVELTKGYKKESAGFVNATMKAYIKIKDELPKEKYARLACEFNYPEWLIREYFLEYGEEKALKIMGSKIKNVHIRLNSRLPDEELKKKLEENGKKTKYGYLVSSTEPYAPYIVEGKATVNALDSVKICRVLVNDKANGDVLDVCAAPGGKSVYIAENNPDVKVYAYDVHPHRVELIKKYALRMQVGNVIAEVKDMREYIPEYEKRFFFVLVDAPCSGAGVVNGNPDILINKTAENVEELNALQKELLSVASRYVSSGGRLVYSTCSNLKKENEEVVNSFLETHGDFTLAESEELGGTQKTFENNEEGDDGFFVCLMTRK
ncbi:MAG: methyltransferase domain-containing protein [Clostridia bacterium]|nr:methyltransferase domain-containing protein [Clostridia bacterium]